MQVLLQHPAAVAACLEFLTASGRSAALFDTTRFESHVRYLAFLLLTPLPLFSHADCTWAVKHSFNIFPV
jgi:hypothetical protein